MKIQMDGFVLEGEPCPNCRGTGEITDKIYTSVNKWHFGQSKYCGKCGGLKIINGKRVSEITAEDKRVISHMLFYGSEFAIALAKAAKLSDASNLTRIKNAFPGMWKFYAKGGKAYE
tara:strand:- start:510 stop:860 length:351 start_codon:yes stop_codon:yes gene_type:complete